MSQNAIGVIQGRLLPKYQGRYQAHPVGYWQDEFAIASKIGLDCVEFILDFNDAEKNPLLSKAGIEQIQAVVDQSGVKVNTICADYFMEAPLHSANPKIADQSQTVLNRLIEHASVLGVSDIVIPCVDQSSLVDEQSKYRFVEYLSRVLDSAIQHNINFSLETDLAPDPFKELLTEFDSKRVTVNYDIGNSAALGFDPLKELDAYGDRITDIHIKDRTLGGGPVTLGEGNANFELFFSKLKEFDYRGPFIMQAYRDAEGVGIFTKQLAWVKPYLESIQQ